MMIIISTTCSIHFNVSFPPRKPHRGTTTQTHAHDAIAEAIQEIHVRRDALARVVQINDRLARTRHAVVRWGK